MCGPIGNCGKEALALVLKGKEGPVSGPFARMQASPREECSFHCSGYGRFVFFLSSFHFLSFLFFFLCSFFFFFEALCTP